jgi:Na+-translocating ferredoxin:NAD+ oxidoreductase RnfD subunit
MSTNPTTIARGAPDSGVAGRLRRFLRTPKGVLSLAFAALLVCAGTAAGWSAVLPHLVAATFGAALVELLVQRVDGGTPRWPSSALLSGTIVALVLGPETAWPVTLAIGALATASKYLLATRRGHVFNPAGLALLVSVPLFATGQSWWGALPELPWPFLAVLLVAGAVVVERVDKLPLVLTFLGTYFGLFTAVALANPSAVVETFREPFLQAALFLAFFMLTDPPTAPGRYREQVWVAMVVAAVSVAAQLAGVGQAYLLVGLLAGNAAMYVRERLAARRPRRAPAAPRSTRAAPRTGPVSGLAAR